MPHRSAGFSLQQAMKVIGFGGGMVSGGKFGCFCRLKPALLGMSGYPWHWPMGMPMQKAMRFLQTVRQHESFVRKEFYGRTLGDQFAFIEDKNART
jgi:hypothetical protein